jgi:N-methylhydantoinase A
VTDANVVLGFLPPDALLGGRMPIRRDLAEAAIGRLGAALGMDAMATAQGILAIVTANMAKALRVISVQRGHDPRDYALMAFGGAGPLHAARLAQEMEMRRVLVPRNPGILCAMGLLLTDLRADFAATRLLRMDDATTPGALAEAFAALEAQAARWFAEEAIGPDARRMRRTVDMRYAGQNYELGIAVPEGLTGDALLAALMAGFAAEHQRLYGFLAEEEPVQIVTARLEASGAVKKAQFRAEPEASSDPDAARSGERQVWLDGAWRAVPLYDRDCLAPGNRIPGPAIVEQMDSTTIVPAGWTARVDGFANLVLEAG